MHFEFMIKKEELEKKRKILSLLTFIGWIISFSVVSNGISIVLPMTEIMLILLDINNINREIILSMMEFFFRYLPTIIYIGGRIKTNSISIEIVNLEEEYFYKEDLNKKKENNSDSENETKEDMYVDLLKEISFENKIKGEEEILKVYDIVDRFELLSRDKQMEVLNFLKGDLNIRDIDLCLQIMELDTNYRNMLQMECEDILFPDFDKKEDINIKKKKK